MLHIYIFVNVKSLIKLTENKFVHLNYCYQGEGGVEIPVSSLTLPHFCTCPQQGPWFPMSCVMVLFVFSELRWEVIVHFVDIDGIIDHHCLNFLFIMISIIHNDTTAYQINSMKRKLIQLWSTIPISTKRTISYPKIQRPLVSSQAALFTSVDKCYILASLWFWCHKMHRILFPSCRAIIKVTKI